MALALGSSASSLRVGSGTPSRMYRGSTAFWDADAAAYIRAVESADGQALELGVCNAYHNFVLACKDASIWSAIKSCCILAGARTLAGALVPLVGTAPTNVADGFVSGDYSRTAGLTGDGTSYLDSGRANNADPQGSKHLAVYATTATSAFRVYAGSSFDTTLYRASGADFFARVNRNSQFTVLPGAGASTGLLAANRPAFGTTEARAGGTTVIESRDANTHIAENTAIFARLSSGVASEISDATIAFYSIGTSLSLEDLDTAVTNLITAIGEAL